MANLVQQLREQGHEVELHREARKPYLAEDAGSTGLGDQLVVWCKTHHRIEFWRVKLET